MRSQIISIQLLVVLVLVLPVKLKGQELVNDRFFKPLYAFDLVAAESIMQTDSASMSTYEYNLLKVHLNWWKLISGYSQVDGFLESSNDFIETYIRELLDSNASKVQSHLKLKLLNAYSFKSRMQLMDDNYFSALRDLRQCILLLEELNEGEFLSEELIFVNAVYDYYYEFAYENYFILRPLLMGYQKGSIVDGLRALEHLSENGNWAISNEANYFLAKIYYESEEDPIQSMVYTKKLLQRYPNNLVYSAKFARALKAANMNQDLNLYCKNEITRMEDMEYLPDRTKEHFLYLFRKLSELE